jgi:hypothetical protein
LEIILTVDGVFHRSQFESEAALEKAILAIQAELFGKNRMYLDVKKKIGVKGSLRNIPDGYLLDLSGQKPRLYVVENELAAHDPLRHIAVQILQFSLSFEAEPGKVRNILMDALQSQAALRERCEKYASSHGFRNLDHMLDYLVSETPFAALVIIDEVPDNLKRYCLPASNLVWKSWSLRITSPQMAGSITALNRSLPISMLTFEKHFLTIDKKNLFRKKISTPL